MHSTSSSRFRQRRSEAVDAAAAVFAEKGYGGASTQLIAQRLGLQQGSLYHYFRSKEEALEAVCFAAVAGALQRLDEIAATAQDSVELVRLVIHARLHGLRTRCHHLIVFNEQRHLLPAERHDRVREASRAYRHRLCHLLEQGMQRGELQAELDPAMLTRALIGLTDSVAGWYLRTASVDVDEVADQFSRLLICGVGAPELSGRPSVEQVTKRYKS